MINANNENLIYIFLIILQLGVIIFFVWRSRLKAKTAAAKKDVPPELAYKELRHLALSVTPHQLKIAIPNSETFIYGVVMDWDMGDVVITLAAYATGACSMYLSGGGGMVGGGKNPQVAEMAVELVTGAKEYLDMTQPVVITDQPAKDCIRFYFLTNQRCYSAEERIDNFENGKSPWLPLFEQANEVITAMRNSGVGALAN